MKTDPYLFFPGTCAEAVAYYRDLLGAEVRALVRHGDMPGGTADPQAVMHAELNLQGSTIFASDAQPGAPSAAGFSISLQVADDAEAERLFAALAEGGAISVPLMTTPFASRFGMVSDRYGTPWMVVTPPAAM